MRKYFDTVIDTGSGRPIAGALVTVTDGSGNAVQLYTDDGVTPITAPINRVTTDANGYFFFYVADGDYTLTYQFGSAERVITDVSIVDQIGNLQPQSIFIDPTGGYVNHAGEVFAITRDITVPAGSGTSMKPAGYILTTVTGDNAGFKGASGLYIQTLDKPGITSGQRGVLYGLAVTAVPAFDRNNAPHDDVSCITLSNDGAGRGTECIYVGRGAQALTQEWGSVIGIDSWAIYGMYMRGHYDYGIDLGTPNYNAVLNQAAIRVPNNVAVVVARNATDNAERTILGVASDNKTTIDAKKIIQRTTFTPTISVNDSSTPTFGSVSGKYSVINGIMSGVVSFQCTAVGGATASTWALISLPLPVVSSEPVRAANTSDSKVLTGYTRPGTQDMTMSSIDGGVPLVLNKFYSIHFSCETNI